MIDTFNFEISIPTDNENFILLKCQLCGELFKIDSSILNDDRFFEIYCPSCGLTSENYITDDVLDLAIKISEDYANNLIYSKLKKLEKNIKGNLFKIKTPHKLDETKLPIMLTVENLENKTYECCKIQAKIKPILKMCSSYCPYCGVKDYGIE